MPEALLAVRSVLVDGGHTGQPFADPICAALGASVQVAKTQRTAKVRRYSPALDRGTVLYLAGINAEGSGKTPSDYSTPAYKRLTSPSGALAPKM